MSSADVPRKKDPSAGFTFGQVLRNRRFLLLWSGQVVSQLGDWLALMALFSLVTFRWQGTPSDVSRVLLFFALPMAILGPVVGVFADRWNRKRTMIASDVVRAALVLLLFFAGEPFQLYVIVFLLSTVSCFFLPSQTALLPVLVQRDELLVANALNTQAVQVIRIVGPALAGILVAWAGERICFLLDSASFLLSAALLARIKVEASSETATRGVPSVFGELCEGLRFLWKHPALRFVVVSLTAALFAIGAFDALAAIYVRDILGSQAELFGAIVALVGAGMILGTLIIGRYAQALPRFRLLLAGVSGLGAGIYVLAATASVISTLGIAVLLGLGASGVNVAAQTLIQEETPVNMLGRVSSTAAAMMTAAQVISIAAAGRLAEWLGIVVLYQALGAALMLMALGGFLYARICFGSASTPGK